MPEKQENRIMGEYSIAKSYKGILRIAHILDLVKNEQDRLFNPTYYGTPRALVDLSKGLTESPENGHRNPKDGMDGSISRYSYINENGDITDDLRHMRVPMTDSMGNYLNWNIGFNGITIGSNEKINGNAIDFECFLQQDGTQNVIWQQKYYPVLETKELVIGLQNKEYPSDKYKVNADSGLVIENNQSLGKLIIENKYDKSYIEDVSADGKLIRYGQNDENFYRTVYMDDKNTVEEYDVFMYQQDNYDVHNYDYKLPTYAKADDKTNGRNNEKILSNYPFTDNSLNPDNSLKPDKKTIDANVGIVNLKDYVIKILEKYKKGNFVEVPTGAIINQFCSLDKWYAYPDSGQSDTYGDGEGYPGHRPAMMSKRASGLIKDSKTGSDNIFVQSTIMGACQKINKLINPDYNFTNTDETSDENTKKDELTYTKSGFHKEIIPLYKRDYVLCDGSTYAIFLFPKNIKVTSYPNRRDSMERFLDLFFAIGYQYTDHTELLNNRLNYKWDEENKNYVVLNGNDDIIDEKNCNNLIANDTNGTIPDGKPNFTKKVVEFLNITGDAKESRYTKCDIHSLFVEDFLTILAFDEIYKKYSQATDVDFIWNHKNICNWLKDLPIPEKYRLNTFVGDSNADLLKNQSKLINRTDLEDKEIQSALEDGYFVMDIPYYNFNNDGSKTKDTTKPLPIINLGREVAKFGDIIKFFDHTKGQWVMIPAYKLPQIQYFIRIFLSNPNVDSLSFILDNYFRYNFQVPNLTQKVPTFIGSSGIDWADSQLRKIKKPQSWSSSYAQTNYMHRHLLFLESRQKSEDDYKYEIGTNKEYNTPYTNGSGPTRYKAENVISGSSYVAPAAWWDGSIVFCSTKKKSKIFDFGVGDHATYIFNELGKDYASIHSQLKINLVNEKTFTNGMTFNIIQSKPHDGNNSTNQDGSFPLTGDYRVVKSGGSGNDFYQDTKVSNIDFSTTFDTTGNIREEASTTSENTSDTPLEPLEETSGKNLTIIGKIWDIDEKLPYMYIENRLNYEAHHSYGFEHIEDPRFESAEPNRGRTSNPVNVEITNEFVKFKINENKNNFTKSDGEWFCPENVKMLPLIKL